MAVAHVNIGSNRGDRMANIRRAVTLISALPDVAEMRVSAPVESEPWGYDSQNRFINVGIAFSTGLPPETLLRRLLDVQHAISPQPHRDTSGAYVDRIIDIDLIAVDDIVIDTPCLTLPHPRMHLREFVLLPMAELAPDWVHPRLHLTPRRLMSLL